MKEILTKIKSFCHSQKGVLVLLMILVSASFLVGGKQLDEIKKEENKIFDELSSEQQTETSGEEVKKNVEEMKTIEDIEIKTIKTEEPNVLEKIKKEEVEEVESAVDVSKETKKDENIVLPDMKDNQFGIAAGGGLIYLDQSDLNEYFQKLKDLGATWVRWDLDWEAIQPNNSNEYQWEDSDRVANTAQKYGINSLGIITYAPRWSQTGSCSSGRHCPPASPATFAKFAGIVAQRYKGVIDVWEIWNEPNIEIFWYPSPSAEEYTALLKVSYTKIKEVNPQAIVISGGLSDAGDEEGVSISPLTFINTLYDFGAKGYFDAVALHPYTYPGYNYGWPQITSVLDLMKEKGDGAKKIWITEYGAPTGGSGEAFEIGEPGFTYDGDFMTEKAQEQMVKDIFAFQSENSKSIGKIFWYNLQDTSMNLSTIENFFGLIHYDGTKKPAYTVLKKMFSD